MNTPAAWEGGCLCGAVRYAAAPPVRSSSVCHCRSCRLASGAPSVGWFVVPLAQFKWLAGTPTAHRSSPPVVRTFCGGCGTPLAYQHDDNPHQIELTTATLDEPGVCPPTREIWHAHKLPWAATNPKLPHWPSESGA